MSENTASIPSTHFQTNVLLATGERMGVVISLNAAGDVQFYLEQPVTHEQFGPEQIVTVLAHLDTLNNALHNYVSARISEAQEAIKKEAEAKQLTLGIEPDATPAEAEACETGTCCGGGCAGEESALDSQPQ